MTRISRGTASLCGIGIAAIAAFALSGHRTGGIVQRIGAVLVGPEADTALGFLLSGAALWCMVHASRWWVHAGRGLGGAAIALGLATGIEYASTAGIGLERLLGPGPPEFTGRMTPAVAVCFVLIGVAVVGLRGFRSRVPQASAAVVAVISFVFLVSAMYEATLAPIGAYRSMAPGTAASFLVLAAGIIAARPHGGIVRLLGAPTPGGRMVRRFLPIALALPILLGSLRLAGQRLGPYDTALGASLFTLVVVTLLVAITIQSARRLDRSEEQRRASERNLERARNVAIERAMDLAAVVDASDDAIISTSLVGTIRSWNRGAERLYGYAAEEAIGQSVRLIVPPERRDEIEDLLVIVASGESVTRLATERLRKSGELVDVLISVSPIRSASGAVIGSAAVARDISELRQEHERFRLAVEAAPSGMILVDAHGRIVLTNREVGRMFGYGPSELIGQPVEVLVPDRSRIGHAAARQQFVETAESRPIGHRPILYGRRKNGTEFPVQIGLNPLTMREGPMTLSVIVDVSEREALLHRLETQAAELKRSNEELTQFASIASHDLQEPLRMVSSFAELLSSRYKERLDERAHTYIGYITEGAARMQQLIRALLEYARVGTRPTPVRPVDINDVVARVLKDLRQLIRRTDAEVVVHPLPSVVGDETQLGQVLSNLLSNAIKFHGESPPRVVVSAERAGSAWQFTVEDNGIGIDAPQHDRVFEIFQRLHERGRYEGSGVGLAIVKRIVERHGGRVWFESSPGRGSRFHFTVPAA